MLLTGLERARAGNTEQEVLTNGAKALVGPQLRSGTSTLACKILHPSYKKQHMK